MSLAQNQNAAGLGGAGVSARSTFLHSVALVLGFTAVFTLLGASVGLIGGYVLYDLLPAIVRVGSILLVVFAIRVAHLSLPHWKWAILALAAGALTFFLDRYQAEESYRIVNAIVIALVVLAAADWDALVLAVLSVIIAALSWFTSRSDLVWAFLPFGVSALPIVESVLVGLVVFFGNRTDLFDREMRLDMAGRGARVSYGRSMIVGVIFAAGWTPCVGPILAGILLLASQAQTALQGALLLAFYSFGLGIPFLIAGALFSRLTVYLPRFYRHLPTISIVSGLLLFLIAILMYTNSLTQLAGLGSFLTLESTLVTESAADISLLLAFVAGLLSFLSPCVLPLVPAYLGYLSGAVIGEQAGRQGTA